MNPIGMDRRTFLRRTGTVAGVAAAMPLVRAFPASAELTFDPTLEPFFHGVASFDPTEAGVLLWTRVEPPAGHDGSPIDVDWVLASDGALTRVIATGTAQAVAADDWCVTVDATGLAPFTHHWFQFSALGGQSLVGRTKTAPAPGVGDEHLRIGVVSCSNYEGGFFNAYGAMAQRNDLDVVFHLGDYIYEYANGGYTSGRSLSEERLHAPEGEMVTLADYRLRYSSYRTDPDLMRVHQLFPMVHTWDDHESTNNSYKDGAQNHTEGDEGTWVDRTAAFTKACQEWLPKRLLDPSDEVVIYRSFQYGALVDLIVMDTRIEGRDEEVSGAIDSTAATDPDREMISQAQRDFVYGELSRSAERGTAWRILAQQVMMMQFNAGGLPRLDLVAQMGGQDGPDFYRDGGNAFNGDAWDGYVGERERLYDHVLGNDIQDIVVLTGDIHTSWAADLTRDPYNPAVYDPTGQNPLLRNVGVEFVTPSVTSPNFDQIAYAAPEFSGETDTAFLALVQALEAAIIAANPHIRMAEIVSHGYNVLDVTAERIQSDWYLVDTIHEPDLSESWHRGFTVTRGQHVTVPALGEAGPRDAGPDTPPARPDGASPSPSTGSDTSGAPAGQPAGAPVRAGQPLPVTGGGIGVGAAAIVGAAVLHRLERGRSPSDS